MTQLKVTFPPEWTVTTTDDLDDDAALGLDDPELSVDGVRAARSFTMAFREQMQQWEIQGLGVLVLVDVDEPAADPATVDRAVAFCAVASTRVVRQSDVGAALQAVAEAGPHPGLTRDTTRIDLGGRPAVRSSAIRLADELVDAVGIAPYVAEVRYVVHGGSDRLAILHFETVTVVHLAALETLFDAIAGTLQFPSDPV